MDGFLSPGQHRILGAMDIPVWVSRGSDRGAIDPGVIEPDVIDEGRSVAGDWSALEREVAGLRSMCITSFADPDGIRCR